MKHRIEHEAKQSIEVIGALFSTTLKRCQNQDPLEAILVSKMSKTQAKIKLIVIPFMSNSPLEDDCFQVNLIAIAEFEISSTIIDYFFDSITFGHSLT